MRNLFRRDGGFAGSDVVIALVIAFLAVVVYKVLFA